MTESVNQDTGVIGLTWRERHPEISSFDLWIGAAAGSLAGAACVMSTAVPKDAFTTLLAMGGVDIALLGVTLIGVQLLVSSVTPLYKKVLDNAGGVRGAARPFLVTAVVAGVGAVFSVLGAITLGVDPPNWLAVVVGLNTLMTVWAIIGAIQLVELGIYHANNRAEIELEMAEGELAIRRRAGKHQA